MKKIKKYTTVIAMGLILLLSSTNTIQANTLTYKTTLHKEIGIATHSCNNYLKSGEPSSGQVVLANSTNKPIISKLTMRIVGVTAKDRQNIISSSPTKASIKIPAFQEVTYEFTNGASVIVKEDISAYIIMKTEHGERKGKPFKILAPYEK